MFVIVENSVFFYLESILSRAPFNDETYTEEGMLLQ